ncbi:MAG: hypothetical protein WA807_02720 [Steroidobacteraceae bacterium]
MHQPVGEFMHQRREFLFRTLTGAHQNEVAQNPAGDAFGQSGAHQAGATALGVEFQASDVIEDCGQRKILERRHRS